MKPKVLIVGNHDGWMGWHLDLFRRGFEELGSSVVIADYHAMGRVLGLPLLSAAAEARRRQRALERVLRREQPDLLLFAASMKFDLHRLRSAYSRPMIFCEYDGWRILEPILDQLREVDFVATMSRSTVERLESLGIRARRIPGAADTVFYSPGAVSEAERCKFGSPVAFVGRSTPRRVEFCSAIADCGLVVYGKRWCREAACAPGGALAEAIRLRRDVTPVEVRTIYRASGVIVNILREGMELLSLQGFDVPACGSCLCTELVPELDELFDLGTEILSFSTPEELRETVLRMIREPETARRIGEAGRRRCLADYTFRHRAERILKELDMK